MNRRFQDRLLAWGARQRQDLPWRRTRDPWAILVSELMLQQTQVSRVAPRFENLLGRFPTPRACAAASVADVVRAWDGLGYNRRAVNLHRAAHHIVDAHAGQVPASLEELLRLPGVGPYTARAVLAFAFEQDVGIVDTNARRVLTRAVAGSPLGPAATQALADRVVPGGHGWAWNQAVLDLGAMVCHSRTPACGACPVADLCVWQRGRAAGLADPAVRRRSSSAAAFEGSDRQGRGRIVRRLRKGPVLVEHLAAVAGWHDDPERARRVARGLVEDGLAAYRADGRLSLPAP